MTAHDSNQLLAEMPSPPAADTLLHLPEKLRERRQWCLASPNEKRPLQANGRGASVTDSSTWTDFETANRIAQEKGWYVGYVLTADDPFTCIDFDVKDDVKPEDFDVHIEMFDSYTERSVSGLGFHVWVEGRVEKAAKAPYVEIYSQDRFMICTGNVHRDRPIMNRDSLVKDLAGQWHGRHPSHSELDAALTTKLWRALLLTPAGQREKARRVDYARKTMGLATNDNQFGEGSSEHGQLIAERILKKWGERFDSWFETDDDLMNDPPIEWLVDDILPSAGFGSLYGASGSGKSFLALDMLSHIARGEPQWMGHKVKKAPCIYMPFEGRGGIRQRIEALSNAAGRKSEIIFFRKPINLKDSTERAQFANSVVRRGLGNGVICIDTLSQAGGGFDENSSSEMTMMINVMQDLRDRTGSAVTVVHHTGKDASRGQRGHSSLAAACDFGLECDGSGPVLRLVKVKDGEDGKELPFSLSKVGVSGGKFSLAVRPRVAEAASAPELDAVFKYFDHGAVSQRQLIEALSQIGKHKVEDAVKVLIKKGMIRKNGKKGAQAKLERVQCPTP